MADRTASIVPPLGDLCTVEIDPQWPHAQYFLEGNRIGRKLSFAFIDLEADIQEESTPNYADTEVVGRAEQYKTFVGTGNREIPLTFRFQAQGLPQNTAGFDAIKTSIALQIAGGPGRSVEVDAVSRAQLAILLEAEVVNPALWLDALKYPVIGAGDLAVAPPPVLLTVGRLIPSTRCILTGGSPVWKPPYDPETLLPFAAEFSATFTVVRSDIKRNLFLHHRQYT
jgi:hypothetical protein